MLYKSKVEYMSGDGVYTMNHILGCSHGCLYPCYAFTSAKRYGQVDSYAEWCRPVAVGNALALLERDLSAKRKEPVERVHLCFTTDPFMYQKDDLCELTLQCIELINSYGVPVTTLTKGMYPFERDPDLLIFKGHPDNEYGITFTTVSEACDIRDDVHEVLCDGRTLEVKPDQVEDVTNLPFEDGQFPLVILDPPHLTNAGDGGWQAKKYGRLPKDWRAFITRAFEECWRVLAPNGTLVFKWYEYRVKLSQILELIPEEPVFGNKCPHASKTHWLVFFKGGHHGND